MHEAAFASSILALALEEARKHGAGERLRVTGIKLEIGLLSCLEAKTLRGCFELLAEGTPAEKAALAVSVRPMSGLCPGCGAGVSVESRSFACPLCGCRSVEWTGGHEMEITAIEAAVVDDARDSASLGKYNERT